MPAFLAMAAVVVFSYPFSRNNFTAARSILFLLVNPFCCNPLGMIFLRKYVYESTIDYGQ